MSVEVITDTMEQFVSQDYRAEWKISKLSSLKSKHVRTPAFCPLPNLNLKFCFEVWFQVLPAVQNNSRRFSVLKMILVKLGGDVPDSMKLQADVKVLYSDRSLYKEYREMPAIDLHEEDNIYYDAVFSDWQIVQYNGGPYPSDHASKMKADELIIKCDMKFFNHLPTPPPYSSS